MSPLGCVLRTVVAFSVGHTRVDTRGWIEKEEDRKIDERNGIGDHKKQIKKHRKCDILWEAMIGGVSGSPELGLNHN